MLQVWKHHKSKIFLVLVMLLTSSIIFIVVKNQVLKSRQDTYGEGRLKYIDSLIYYRNRAGNVVAKVYEKVRYELTDNDKHLIDSLRTQLRLKQKEVAQVLSIQKTTMYEADASISEVEFEKDTLPTYSYEFTSSYLEYRAKASPDSLRFSKFITKDSLYILYSKNKIGGRDYRKVHIMNTNPNSTIIGAKSFQYEEPREYSRLSFGLHAGINPINRQPVVSIGINYDIIRLKKKR